MNRIHPSAHVDPGAQLGDDITIAQNVIVDPGCVIGNGCVIRANAVITGGTVMGEENEIGYGAVIGGEPQDRAFKNVESKVILGNRNILRENVTVHRGTQENTSTVIGNDCFLMVGSHLAHNCVIGDQVTLVNNVLLAGYVEVESQAFVGGDVVVHQNVRIGSLAMIRGQTRIGRDVPPFFMATGTNQVNGLNRVGLKRAGVAPAERKAIQQAYDLLYNSGLNISQAAEQMEKALSSESQYVQALVHFIRHSKRGICLARAPLRGEAGSGAEENG